MPSDAEELVDQLYDMVQKAFALPFGQDKCILDRDKVLGIIDELRATLPGDIKAARQIVQNRNDVLASAKREADDTKRQAEEHARRVTSQEEILQNARRKAADIVYTAETKTVEMQKMALSYLDEELRKAEETISVSLGELRKTRAEFRSAVNHAEKAKPKQTES